jgi:hypothetical protein
MERLAMVITLFPVGPSQADDPPHRTPVGIDAMQDHTADGADRLHAPLVILVPGVEPFTRRSFEQQKRQLEWQIAFKTVAVAFRLIPLEVFRDFGDNDIRRGPIYVKDAPFRAL